MKTADATTCVLNAPYKYNDWNLIKRWHLVVCKVAAFQNIPAKGTTTIGSIPNGFQPIIVVNYNVVSIQNYLYQISFTNSANRSITVYNYQSALSGSDGINQCPIWFIA